MKKPSKRKRPKSVMQKAWATRRLKAMTLVDREEFLKGVAAHMPTAESNADPQNPNSRLRSEVDGIARTIELHRDEMLLGFLGDMAAVRGMRPYNDHHPMLVSRAQAEAIEQFLTEQGYSPWGRRSGAAGDQNAVEKAA